MLRHLLLFSSWENEVWTQRMASKPSVQLHDWKKVLSACLRMCWLLHSCEHSALQRGATKAYIVKCFCGSEHASRPKPPFDVFRWYIQQVWALWLKIAFGLLSFLTAQTHLSLGVAWYCFALELRALRITCSLTFYCPWLVDSPVGDNKKVNALRSWHRDPLVMALIWHQSAWINIGLISSA